MAAGSDFLGLGEGGGLVVGVGGGDEPVDDVLDGLAGDLVELGLLGGGELEVELGQAGGQGRGLVLGDGEGRGPVEELLE